MPMTDDPMVRQRRKYINRRKTRSTGLVNGKAGDENALTGEARHLL